MEIERKFLVVGDAWRGLTEGVLFRQGYLSIERERVVRVRIAGDRAFLTIKGITRGISRQEYEYPIPLHHAEQMLQELCVKPIIEKKRYQISFKSCLWSVDEFLGENEGLIIAEIELASEEVAFEKPDWVGAEVSSDPRYFNANLVEQPFRSWGRRK
ncbi:CYTH domain-containing protein [candidate division KSB1 bacterium]|nr:CYTH domain-containing protein [candidate division KSB1 bacterium]